MLGGTPHLGAAGAKADERMTIHRTTCHMPICPCSHHAGVSDLKFVKHVKYMKHVNFVKHVKYMKHVKYVEHVKYVNYVKYVKYVKCQRFTRGV
jgi:hypothetical protein